MLLLFLAASGAMPRVAAGQQAPAAAPASAWGVPAELDMEAVHDYLDAIDRVELRVEMEVGGNPNSRSPLGPILAKAGTVLEIVARFDAAGLDPGERERGPVITELKIGPKGGELLRLGPLSLKDHDGQGVVWLGPGGAVCLGLDFEVRLLFKKNFREQLCVESLETTAEGHVEFNSVRRGFLARWVVPEIRITREGVVEKKGVPFLPWLGGWRPLDPSAPRVPMPLPQHDWPIRLSDLLDWLPRAAEAEAVAEDKPELPIAVPRLELHLDASMARGEVEFREPAARFVFADHVFELRVHGGFDGRTFRTDPGRASTLKTSWTNSGSVEVASLGRAEIASARVDLDGELAATFPLLEIERREARVDFGVGIALALSAVELRTEEGIALSLPTGLTGSVDGSGSAALVAGQESPVITLTPGSTVAAEIAGPLTLDRPLPTAGPPPLIELPGRVRLAAGPDAPLLRLDGEVGSGSTGDPASPSARNLTRFDLGFALTGVGADEFGLRTLGGLVARFGPGTEIGLSGKMSAAAGLAGLESIDGAELDLDLRLPDAGGEIALHTPAGLDIEGRLLGGEISLSTGPLTRLGGSVIGTRGKTGKIDGNLRLRLGGGDTPTASGGMRLGLDGRLGLRLDPGARKTEPRGPLLAGPVLVDLSLALDVEGGATFQRAEGVAPLVFPRPARFDLRIAGPVGPGAGPRDLAAVEISFERPVGATIELKPE